MIPQSDAGVFMRGGSSSSGRDSSAVNSGGNYQGLGNANGNIGFRRQGTSSYMAGDQTRSQYETNADDIKPNIGLRSYRQAAPDKTSGLTAWGIITIIVIVILVGFCGYYGIICYPLFMDKDSHNQYDHMDLSSTTTTSTPTRSTEFGKIEYDDEEFRFAKMNEKQQWATENS